MYLYYKFDYKNHNEDYSFDLSKHADILIEGIRKWFDDRLVTLDGTDTAVYNAIAESEDFLDLILDEMEDWYTDRCKDIAFEEYKDYIDWYYDDED